MPHVNRQQRWAGADPGLRTTAAKHAQQGTRPQGAQQPSCQLASLHNRRWLKLKAPHQHMLRMARGVGRWGTAAVVGTHTKRAALFDTAGRGGSNTRGTVATPDSSSTHNRSQGPKATLTFTPTPTFFCAQHSWCPAKRAYRASGGSQTFLYFQASTAVKADDMPATLPPPTNGMMDDHLWARNQDSTFVCTQTGLGRMVIQETQRAPCSRGYRRRLRMQDRCTCKTHDKNTRHTHTHRMQGSCCDTHAASAVLPGRTLFAHDSSRGRHAV